MKTILCALALAAFSHTAYAQEAIRDQVDQQLVEMNDTIEAARMVPEMRGGQMIGVKSARTDAYDAKGFEKIGYSNGEGARTFELRQEVLELQTIEGEKISNEAVSQ